MREVMAERGETYPLGGSVSAHDERGWRFLFSPPLRSGETREGVIPDDDLTWCVGLATGGGPDVYLLFEAGMEVRVTGGDSYTAGKVVVL